MAREKKKQFRVGKIEILKTVARRPKGLYRPDHVHRDAKLYNRPRARRELKRNLEE